MCFTSALRISRPELVPSDKLLTAVVTLPPESSDCNILYAYSRAASEKTDSNKTVQVKNCCLPLRAARIRNPYFRFIGTLNFKYGFQLHLG